MEWTMKPGLPIYIQIIEQIKMHIARGEFQAGQKLASVRDLAVDVGVNPNTMQKALAELEKEGILFSERTCGRFVTKEEAVLSKMKKELSYRFISELFENLGKIGMKKEEIIEAVKNWTEEEEK